MSEIKTYPEMNERIKDILRLPNDGMNKYILARIEELEAENEQLRTLAVNTTTEDFKGVEIDQFKNKPLPEPPKENDV